MIFSIMKIPEGWFLRGTGECVKPQHYVGDTHENTGEGFWCELQHRKGGRLTCATGASIEDALDICIAKLPTID